jgi:hypothetical protein
MSPMTDATDSSPRRAGGEDDGDDDDLNNNDDDELMMMIIGMHVHVRADDGVSGGLSRGGAQVWDLGEAPLSETGLKVANHYG